MKIWLVLLLVIIIAYLIYSHVSTFISNPTTMNILRKCQVPTLGTEKCFWSQYQECPRYNGSYQQCTNNYIPKNGTGRCDCRNRTFEMCPSPYKVSDKCVYNSLF